MVQISVLDLIPVRSSQTTGQAVHASINLARVADTSSVTRFWVAEHHNARSIASTNPPVLMAMIASATEQLKVGSGGVMLPNHSPLVIAEQFALLEAAFPGRIDLGIGRAPGTDPVTSWALRGGHPDSTLRDFPDWLDQVNGLVAGNRPVQIGTTQHYLSATPAAISAPRTWLLGSSEYSAHLAATKALPYAFAHHFSGQGTEEALRIYRNEYTGTDRGRVIVSVNVAVADDTRTAWRETLPYQRQMARLRLNLPGTAMETVEQAEAAEPLLSQEASASLTAPWIVGDPFEVAQGIFELADRFEIDEVMIHPINGAHDGDPVDSNPGREFAIRELTSRLVDVS